jgi:cobalamin biosynthesis Mg chelatase CobN
MKRMALTICAVLGLQAAPVWAATNQTGARTSETTLPLRADGAKPATSAGAGASAAAQAPQTSTSTSTSTSTASTYATREAAKPELARFKGGGTSLYIGGSTLVIVLLVVLLIVLL